MAPEYVIRGEISLKTDVYSFGVVVLEIISVQKNGYLNTSGSSVHLVSYVSGNIITSFSPSNGNFYLNVI